MSPQGNAKSATYRWPGVMVVTIILGLLFALLGDGPWDAMSWVLLAIPLGVIGRRLIVHRSIT